MAKAILLMGLVVLATLCMAEAGLLNPTQCQVTVNNKCSTDVVLSIGAAKPVACKKEALTTIGPLSLKLNPLKLLSCEISCLTKKAQLVKATVSLELLKLGTVIAGVQHLALDLVEDVKEGVVKVLCGPLLLCTLKL